MGVVVGERLLECGVDGSLVLTLDEGPDMDALRPRWVLETLGGQLHVHAPEVPVEGEAPALHQVVRRPVGGGHVSPVNDSFPSGCQRHVLRSSPFHRVQKKGANAAPSVLRVDGSPPVQLAVICSGQ